MDSNLFRYGPVTPKIVNNSIITTFESSIMLQVVSDLAGNMPLFRLVSFDPKFEAHKKWFQYIFSNYVLVLEFKNNYSPTRQDRSGRR